MATIHATIPPFGTGAYWAQGLSAVTTSEPTTGRGSIASSPATAVWDTLGLLPDSFEVIIETVVFGTGTTLFTIVELHGGPASIFVTGAVEGLNIPMRDGFLFSSTGGGAIITFRIQLYQR